VSLNLQAATTATTDSAAMCDTATNPCDNFFQYACGGWIKNTELPPDRPIISRGFSDIDQRNDVVLKQILEDLSKGHLDKENPDSARLGRFYKTCMNATEVGSAKTLKSELAKVEKITKDSLTDEISWFHSRGLELFFSFGKNPDFKDPAKTIADIDEGGLNLPSQFFYLDESDSTKSIRAEYLKYLSQTFELSGDSKQVATSNADRVLKLETKLAAASLSPADRRDPEKLYHIYDLSKLRADFPHIEWEKYFSSMGLASFKKGNVSSPNYFKILDQITAEGDLATIKAYTRARLITSSGKALPSKYLTAYFDFFGRQIYGMKELPPRSKLCSDMTLDQLGFAMSRSFVNRQFKGDSKAMAKEIIENVKEEVDNGFSSVSWMDEPTKTAARKKLKGLSVYIGFPEKWRTYQNLKLVNNSFLENYWSAKKVNAKYDLQKIGQSTDRTDWSLLPGVVNAAYQPQYIRITFPAGILQDPFFDIKSDKTTNYAGIGMVAGHEFIHAFDDQGRLFDDTGAVKNWWSAEAEKSFKEKAACLAQQVESLPIAGNAHLNSKLVLGEVMGDQAGLKAGFNAWLKTLPASTLQDTEKLRAEKKKFFLNYGQAWCSKSAEAFEVTTASHDPHPPDRHRVNLTLANFPEFAEAYSCPAKSKMSPEVRCPVW
jgi:endothelin-converting enzyme/putative endopeptidase